MDQAPHSPLRLVSNTSASSSSWTPLPVGAEGAAVIRLQEMLKSWGFDLGSVTGRLEGATVEALMALQRKLGIYPSGEFSHETIRAIEADLVSDRSLLQAAEAALTLSDSELMPTTALAPTSTSTSAASPSTSPWAAVAVLVGVGAALWYFTRSRMPTTIIPVDKAEDALSKLIADMGEGDEEEEEEKPQKKKKRKQRPAAEQTVDASPVDASPVDAAAAPVAPQTAAVIS